MEVAAPSRHQEITGAGLLYLKDLPGLNNRHLTNPQVTDAGVSALQKALPKCTIRT